VAAKADELSDEMSERILAFDVGGTLIKLGVVDSTGTVTHARHLATEASRGGQAMLSALLDVARPLVEQYRLAGIAFSTLGVIDSGSGTVRGAADAIAGYLGQSPKRLFETEFGLPVVVENDVNCVAVAEGWRGAAHGVANYIALTLGTGIGGGIVINGQLHRGAHAAAGEWGYMIVDGRRWEDVASLRGLAELAVRAGAAPDVDAQQVFRLSDQGSALHAQVVARWRSVLASGMANLIYAFDPQRIIIGGGITGRGPVFLRELAADLDALLHPDFAGLTELALAAAGNHAGLLGAARCWFQQNHLASSTSLFHPVENSSWHNSL
jgi:predicted NBD/HSP70 family sugar kinase